MAAPYRSAACSIGTHLVCVESSPALAPVDVPVIYEACGCPCHLKRDQLTPEEVAG
ncbi:hypothetical protein ACIPRD_26800 [Streptomyces sp. NPDC090108]|uniref:hypothetical protein n=1 Tax=Streptomyces sp. NPDC090108 TaxID=3365947 RepID=UPI00380DAB0F